MKLADDLLEALRAGDRIDDAQFDQILPPKFERLSDVQWSSSRVARVVKRMTSPGDRFLDLGCGPGKLCLLLALTTDLVVAGVERRGSLIALGRRLCEANAPGRVELIQADMMAIDWTAYDVLYLYNPFMEHKCSRFSGNLIDSNISLSTGAYETYVNDCFVKLASLRTGQRVITYHGFGGAMPDTMKMLDSERVGSGTVRLWEVIAPAPPGTGAVPMKARNLQTIASKRTLTLK